jgi:hypothetical protein
VRRNGDNDQTNVGQCVCQRCRNVKAGREEDVGKVVDGKRGTPTSRADDGYGLNGKLLDDGNSELRIQNSETSDCISSEF